MSVHGKKAGVDTLKIVLLNGCNYRFREYRRVYILQQARKKTPESRGEVTKKQKDVFIVNKSKWYAAVSDEELASIAELSLVGGDCEREHRIIQHKLR